MDESNLESSLPKLNREKPLEQYIKNPIEQLKGGQSETKVEIETENNDEIQQVKDCHIKCTSTNVEGVKYALQNYFFGESKKLHA